MARPTACRSLKESLVTESALISCVDDDPTVLEALEDLLDALGFEVDGYPSAEEFLSRGRLEATTCLITDVRLGGMSGLELQHRLAAASHNIPTIVISAFADDQTRTRAFNAGAICVLAKPVSRENLINCIRLALHPT
ncbi:response regulator [Bradyrhizobium sp. WYCCWR 13022]|uniref:response regulator transcription factor n=1 Tax=unclassified Bradyrhizobium TaxID=2631580 RepID=UPI00263A4DB3|nr:response regulator [Bradyrhizobium sp. WYCCWR 13022]MDN4984161.1 response regulator [Bradyrhizobium sp. WYCCWR 13022]